MRIKFGNLSDEGILYILVIKLEGKELVKVGITSRKIEDRVCEILTSVWKKYRVFPELRTKRFKKVDGYRDKERSLHKYLKAYKYKTQFVFGGSGEMFDVDVDEVVKAYTYLLLEGTLDGYQNIV